MNETQFDFAIVGAGMAGASLAAHLAPHGSVLLLEAEEQPGYHATGRSSAFWEECYGGPDIVPLTLASYDFLEQYGFLGRRGALYVGREIDVPRMDGFADRFSQTGVTLERKSRADLAAKVPGLREEWNDGIWEAACSDIDVAALHAHYLSAAAKNGMQIVTQAKLGSARHDSSGWQISTEAGDAYRVSKLVNAAGAWADQVARISGIMPLGIRPMLRTVVQLRVTPEPLPDLPLVMDISGEFYFKPENGRIWLSPQDETRCEPCDAAPDELTVAKAIDQLEKVVDWQIDAVEHKWAGLRSFAADRLPVYGADDRNPDFYWFAGQGGFGIQTAPAAAELMAAQILSMAMPSHLASIDVTKYAPARFG